MELVRLVRGAAGATVEEEMASQECREYLHTCDQLDWALSLLRLIMQHVSVASRFQRVDPCAQERGQRAPHEARGDVAR